MIPLAVDASILVAESLRRRGQDLIEDPQFELYIAEHIWSEVLHELRQRITILGDRGRLATGTSEEAFDRAVDALQRNVTVVPQAEYERFEGVARLRIPRDPNDWPTVAVAMLLDAAIWTSDYDFFGCGLATWTTETLLIELTS
jgi:predicted nucleic acid-binding protein